MYDSLQCDSFINVLLSCTIPLTLNGRSSEGGWTVQMEVVGKEDTEQPIHQNALKLGTHMQHGLHIISRQCLTGLFCVPMTKKTNCMHSLEIPTAVFGGAGRGQRIHKAKKWHIMCKCHHKQHSWTIRSVDLLKKGIRQQFFRKDNAEGRDTLWP